MGLEETVLLAYAVVKTVASYPWDVEATFYAAFMRRVRETEFPFSSEYQKMGLRSGKSTFAARHAWLYMQGLNWRYDAVYKLRQFTETPISELWEKRLHHACT